MNRVLPVIVWLCISVVAVGQGYEKEAKKQLKTLKKEGWQTLPQDEELLAQLTQSLELRGNAGTSRILVSEGASTTENFEAAMKTSSLMAERNLAGLFASSVASLVKSDKTSGLERFLSESIVKVAASIKTDKVMRIYRESEGNYEFRTVVSCRFRDIWNLLPSDDKSTLETQFGLTDEAIDSTGGK